MKNVSEHKNLTNTKIEYKTKVEYKTKHDAESSEQGQTTNDQTKTNEKTPKELIEALLIRLTNVALRLLFLLVSFFKALFVTLKLSSAKLAKIFWPIFTLLSHKAYEFVRVSYDKFKKIKGHFFKGYDLNPYHYISLYPTDLKLEVIEKEYEPNSKFPKYTTITPVLNEENTIVETLEHLEKQTHLPNQVIIVDAQSTDSTLQKIEEYKQNSKLDILVLSSDKKHISYQRNLAIENARNEIIINVDAGAPPCESFAANLLGPFTEHPEIELTAGIQAPKTIYPWSLQFTPKHHFQRRKEPYGNCVAYKKSIFEKAGKYPEFVTYAAEDTFLFYNYKKLSKHWMFNKAAYVYWEHPETFFKAQQKVMNYMLGNFEIGLWPYFYNGTRFNIPLWIGYFFKAFRATFPQLMNRQAEVEIKKRNIKGLYFIFSKARITDEGNDKLRDMAVNLIKQNYKVFFVDFADKAPKNKTPVFIDTDHSLLELVHYKQFHFKNFKKRYGKFIENAVFYADDLVSEIAKMME